MKISAFIFCFLLLKSCFAANVLVYVDGIQNLQGSVHAGLFANEQNFPDAVPLEGQRVEANVEFVLAKSKQDVMH